MVPAPSEREERDLWDVGAGHRPRCRWRCLAAPAGVVYAVERRSEGPGAHRSERRGPGVPSLM